MILAETGIIGVPQGTAKLPLTPNAEKAALWAAFSFDGPVRVAGQERPEEATLTTPEPAEPHGTQEMRRT